MQDTLFSSQEEGCKENFLPLSEFSRPDSFENFMGQNFDSKISSPFRVLIEKMSFNSLILWGPPGCGKTTLANIIKNIAPYAFISLSAVDAGVKEIREEISRKKRQLHQSLESVKVPVLFIDELHRLNKAQQDIFLPIIENGSIKFIGASTENPSFEINNAILSRSHVLKMLPLNTIEIEKILKRAVCKYNEKYLVAEELSEEVFKRIAANSDGDARKALNCLELILSNGQKPRCLEKNLDFFLQQNGTKYDKNKDYHYDLISAFIKSIRASEVDAAIYYLARMLNAGESPDFIARRLIISASEDIGMANPHCLNFASSAASAVKMIGMPEAKIILSHVTTLLATSPKSNSSYQAIRQAEKDVELYKSLEVPLHLRNAPSKLMMGYGQSYQRPLKEDVVKNRNQSYLPHQIAGKKYYVPKDSGYEKNICLNYGKKS